MGWLLCGMTRVCALCVCVCLASICAEGCLMISEVNSDNPKFDTHEFVELFHSSGTRTPLNGYTLVLYNGNGNLAYRVVDLTGHSTDERGFFLIGSRELSPQPAVALPPNSIQNGPDAVALYGPGTSVFEEGDFVRTKGLVDALVYATRRGGDVEGLAGHLTPGSPPFLEDPSLFDEDESIQRCLETEHHWAFRVAPPTPGRANNCTLPAPALARIEELRLGGLVTSRHVELSVATEMGAMALVVFDGQTGAVRKTMDIAGSGQSSLRLLSVSIDTSGTGSTSGAVVLYEGKVADVLSQSLVEPVDAFVFSADPQSLNATLLETLTPGRQPYTLTHGWEDGLSLSRCGVADWSRDSGTFMEAVSTPSLRNHCPWPKICPHDIVIPDGTPPPTLTPWLGTDFLLNEVNSDSPGVAENTEFIEIWHPSGTRTSLEGVWLLLINGQTGRPYKEISLSGFFTDANGYFLIGSNGLEPKPSIPLPPNTVQNGPDAVALYRSQEPPSQQTGTPRLGLLDAVVYRVRGSDKDGWMLTEALTPYQLPLLEDPQALPGDESISRCQGRPNTLSAFRVGPPTPMAKNVCPHPPSPEGLAINEVGGALGPNHTQESMFVELIGPPRTSLDGLVLMVFEGGTREAIPLQGHIGADGLYLLNHTSGTDAVVLCYGVGVCDADSEILDSVIFTDVPLHLKNLPASTGHINPAIRAVADGHISLSRCSCCQHNSPSSWITSSPTPGLPNHCPSPTYSSTIHLCLEPQPLDGQDQAGSNHTNENLEPVSTDCSGEVAVYLEQQCNCGITTLYLQGVNVSCVSGLMYLQGSIPALSEHQRELITHTTSSTHSCMRTGSLALPVGIVLGVLFLLLMGVALFIFLYRRKRPLDYSSMELSEHVEL
ncbi:hypothetical protein AALO_G00275130 [Alosa alosa]|uniref:LTD domain-containing protein n=1 Tax=Alosa alosa TaxID=278164 RepID=A0AAV6FMK1_9TELE|nr:uncharacterized protein si:ch211-183d21.1 [Alosa alosa]KAG5262437.1 hypothetical protein AALO_G00275130 [Alosa alosa]